MALVLAISLTPFNYSLALDTTENADGGGSGGGGYHSYREIPGVRHPQSAG